MDSKVRKVVLVPKACTVQEGFQGNPLLAVGEAEGVPSVEDRCCLSVDKLRNSQEDDCQILTELSLRHPASIITGKASIHQQYVVPRVSE